MIRRAALACLLAGATRVFAQAPLDPHAVQPERPTVATHAGTVAPGWLEIEAGVEHDRFDPSTSQSFAPIVAKIGVGPRMQLNISGSAVHNEQGSALGDMAAALKWRVLDDAPLLGDFAIMPGLKAPTGSVSRGTGTGTTDGTLLLISSHELGPVDLDVNVGYTRRSGDGRNAPTSATLWTASFGGPLLGAVGWVAECYGYPGTSGPSGQAPIVAVLAGPTLLVRPWLALDAGLIVPVAGPQAHALYAGGVYNVGRLWRTAPAGAPTTKDAY
jgi:hypothetical protein